MKHDQSLNAHEGFLVYYHLSVENLLVRLVHLSGAMRMETESKIGN